MLSRVLREFYPKAEFLGKASDYEHLDNSVEGIRPIKIGKISNRKYEKNKFNKELILGEISKIIIERVKEKINTEFSSEFIKKIDELGAGKYLNDNLKNKVLDIVNEKKKNANDDCAYDVTNGVEGLMQDINEITRRTVGIDGVIQIEPQTVHGGTDISDGTR